MPKFTTRVISQLSLSLCAWGCISSCRPDLFEELESNCESFCTDEVACGGLDPDWQSSCELSCVGRGEETLEAHGKACARSYDDLLGCLGSLQSCEDLVHWYLREEIYPCKAETTTFADECPGVWISP